MREALLYEHLGGGRVRCNVCQVRCVIAEGDRGACQTRLNRGGVLYTLIYGLTSSVCVDPIEKKPLFHFYPGTRVFSAGTLGCNFRCPGCQNYQISHQAPGERDPRLQPMSPAESIELAVQHGCRGICWTYNEPTIWFEHTLETAQLARVRGLYTAYVTNGYITPEALDMIGPYLDAFRVDIKGFSREVYKRISGIARFEGILEVTVRAQQRWGLHVECVTNVTPTVNDDPVMLRDTARWIRDSLGPHTPWHITRFYPHLDLSHLPPTPLRTLESAYEAAREEGLAYVYLGNVPGHRGENTWCHSCGALAIERSGMAVVRIELDEGVCCRCGARIPGRFGRVGNLAGTPATTGREAS